MSFSHARLCVAAIAVLFAAGCNRISTGTGDQDSNADTSDANTSTDGDADVDATVTGIETSDAADADASDTSETTGDDCGSFLGCDDMPTYTCPDGAMSPSLGGGVNSKTPAMCNFWNQDCPDGEKCTVFQVCDGIFDANDCVAAGTVDRGSPCELADGPQGTDTCNAGSICLGVSESTFQGVCVEFCSAPESDPVCATPGSRCAKLNQGVLNLCLAPCDPLVADPCGAGERCLGMTSGNDGYLNCMPGDDDPQSLAGDPCFGAYWCSEGQACIGDDRSMTTCGEQRCCSDVCDLNAVSPCGSAAICVPLGDPAQVHMGYCKPN